MVVDLILKKQKLQQKKFVMFVTMMRLQSENLKANYSRKQVSVQFNILKKMEEK